VVAGRVFVGIGKSHIPDDAAGFPRTVDCPYPNAEMDRRGKSIFGGHGLPLCSCAVAWFRCPFIHCFALVVPELYGTPFSESIPISPESGTVQRHNSRPFSSASFSCSVSFRFPVCDCALLVACCLLLVLSMSLWQHPVDNRGPVKLRGADTCDYRQA
jgi:hypothetical protein